MLLIFFFFFKCVIALHILAKSLGVPVSGIMDAKYTISINLTRSKLVYVMWRMFYHRIACLETENF